MYKLSVLLLKGLKTSRVLIIAAEIMEIYKRLQNIVLESGMTESNHWSRVRSVQNFYINNY